MCHGIRNLLSLKVICYVAPLVDLNEYLDVLPGEKISDKICVTELYEILLNSMPNIWSKQAYVQGFDYEYITFKSSVSMFEHMEIVESIYEGLVEPSC